MDWQPIETAPTDGTDVLIASVKHGLRVARYESFPWANNLHWFIALGNGPSGGTYAADATHWMPLPGHPVVNAEEW